MLSAFVVVEKRNRFCIRPIRSIISSYFTNLKKDIHRVRPFSGKKFDTNVSNPSFTPLSFPFSNRICYKPSLCDERC